MKRGWSLAAALTALAAFVVIAAGPAAGDPFSNSFYLRKQATPSPSGTYEFRDVNLGTNLTECPQTRLKKVFPAPPERRVIDSVEQYSEGGDDRRTNEEFSCNPQNETAIDSNPLIPKNLVAGANDYRLGWATSGVYASNDSGQTWYGSLLPFPSLPSGENLDGGGDPAVVFDRAGIAYYAEINFNRIDDTSGIFVGRSTNGGYTWNRMCVAIDATPADPTDDQGRCGGAGDVRQPGDGVVSFQQDQDRLLNGSVPFDDKEWIDAGPRPAGVEPVCFGAFTRTPQPCNPAVVGVDRLHVTWTKFTDTEAAIWFSYSDDQGRSWSQPKIISGSAAFCAFGTGNACDFDQFSVPTVSPTTGHLYVAFENFNTPDENQILVVRSRDGGNTFEGPFFVTPVYDVNYPRSGAGGGRPDCGSRGQQNGRPVLTNSCFRVPSTLAIVADQRGGAFADDLYIVMFDNRNGTRVSTNGDVFVFKSLDGGSNWIGPSRVNNDATADPANRDCPRTGATACPPGVHTGNDQFWPWLDINKFGHLNIVFHDRRLDTRSTATEWPTSRSRTGNYLVWNWGAQCHVKASTPTACMAPGAAVIPQPTAPIDPSGGSFAGLDLRGPFHNFGISDFPSNWDYCFRAGIFCGDYNGVAVVEDDTKAYAHWTDARNGRSSGGPTSPQAGRNPICEQSDVMVDEYSTTSADAGQKLEKPEDRMFDVTPCPGDSGEIRNR